MNEIYENEIEEQNHSIPHLNVCLILKDLDNNNIDFTFNDLMLNNKISLVLKLLEE